MGVHTTHPQYFYIGDPRRRLQYLSWIECNVGVPNLDTFLSTPTCSKIWNMQFVQDEQHVQIMPVAISIIILIFIKVKILVFIKWSYRSPNYVD